MVRDNERNQLIKKHADKLFKDKKTREKVGTLLHMANLEGYFEASDNSSKFWVGAMRFHTIVIYALGMILGFMYDSWQNLALGLMMFTLVYLGLSWVMDMAKESGKQQAELER